LLMAPKGGRRFRKRYGIEPDPRERLLRQITEAQKSGDRKKMVEALEAVNHWIGQYGFDWVVMDARDELRRTYRDNEYNQRS
jgi:hypothetical protein